MKYQQVSVDLTNMVFTAVTYLALAGAAWLFLRLLQACFSLPGHMKKRNDVQQMLQDKVDSYEKYVLDCEEKEKNADSVSTSEKEDEKPNENTDPEALKAKWKERRECLEMLKRELQRVRDGGDPYDWEHLLDDDEEDKIGEIIKAEGEQSEEVTTEIEKKDEEQDEQASKVSLEEKKEK